MIRKRIIRISSCFLFVLSCVLIFTAFCDDIHFIDNNSRTCKIDILFQVNVHKSMLITGIVLNLITVVSLIHMIRKEQMIRKLFDSGIRVYGKIIEIRRNERWKLTSKFSFYISCEYFDEAEQKLYYFKSERLWRNSAKIDKTKKIPVYVQVNDFSKYYVDVKSLIQNA